MSGNRNSLGTISRGDSSRRRRKRKDDTIRMILAVVLVCVLVMVVGFLGVNALRGNGDTDDKNQTNSGEDILQNGTEGETEGETSGETTGLETTEATDVQTQPEDTYVPETVTKEHIVWLDAGHGGTDWGSAEWVRNEAGQIVDKDGNPTTEDAGDGEWVTREKYDTLDLTLLIQQELEARGVTVIMTRTDDTFVHRFDRAAMVEESDAECFISIHRNYMIGDTDQCGIEAWLVNEVTRAQYPGKEKDVDIVGYIFDQLENLGDKTNGILGYFRNTDPEEYISVLWRHSKPSVLLEMGYMSNDSDNEKYELYMQDYAVAIADGIVQWLRTQE